MEARYNNMHLTKEEKIKLEERRIETLEHKLQFTPDDEQLRLSYEEAKQELNSLINEKNR